MFYIIYEIATTPYPSESEWIKGWKSFTDQVAAANESNRMKGAPLYRNVSEVLSNYDWAIF